MQRLEPAQALVPRDGGVRGRGRREHEEKGLRQAPLLLRIDVTPILTHRFTLEQYREAFLACGEQGKSGAVKVLFTYDANGCEGPSRS